VALPCTVKPGGGTGVVEMNLPAKASLTVDYGQLGKTSHDIAIYPFVGNGLSCDAQKAVSCQAAAGSGTLSFPNLAAGKYWIVVEADQPGDEGPIVLQLTAK
jgi:hypothetical protein